MALTTLAKVKAWIRETGSGNDAFITELIPAVQNRMETICDRKFDAAEYRQWIDGAGYSPLQIKHWPIIDVYRVAHGRDNALSASFSTAGTIRATIGMNALGVVLQSVGSDGTVTTTTTALLAATVKSVNALVTAIDAVSGWDATEVKNVPTLDLRPCGGMDALDQTAFLTYPHQDLAQYEVDYAAGIVHVRGGDDWSLSGAGRFPHDFRNVLIHYKGGYSSIPEDLDILCREFCAEVFALGQKDTNVASESLVDYSYSLVDRAVQALGWYDRLAHWRNR